MHKTYAITFYIFKILLNEKGGEGGNVPIRGGAQKTRSACRELDLLPTTYYLLSYYLLIYTTYYLSNPSSRRASTLGRRAHFGGPVRRSPYTRGTQCRGAEPRQSAPDYARGALCWPVTRIRGVATLTLGFWPHSGNARTRGIAP